MPRPALSCEHRTEVLRDARVFGGRARTTDSIMTELLDSLRFICVSHLAVYIVFLLGHYRRINSARYSAAFCAGLICYLVYPLAIRLGAPDWLQWALIAIMSCQGFCFWMLALSFFRDGFRSRWHHWLILFFRISCSLLLFAVYPAEDLSPINEFLYSLPLVIFSVVLAGLGVWEALREYSSDLIESRRRLRVWYLTVGGGAIVFVSLFRLGIAGPDLREVHELATLGITLLLIYAFFLSGLQLRESLFESGPEADPEYATASGRPKPRDLRDAPDSGETGHTPVDADLARKLTAAFEDDLIYRREGLTIRQLARYLDAHEYRVRRLINAGLGYRNFNDFLNRYRIQEACEILLDSERARLPIVRIADDLGYRSLGSFNKAFRELTGQTPSEYRKNSEPG
ncbi:MAG: helix-turn-helix transcriptional regulator [Leptospirales bacterium]|jgi:AraC-like DNA-binding protein